MGKRNKKKAAEKVERRRRRRERLDERGRELGDSTPMAPPVGYKKEPTIAERIRLMVRGEALRQAAEAAGVETFEEADDFDVEDDDTFDPSTPYEEVFEPPARALPGAEGVGGRGREPSVSPSRSKEDDDGGVRAPSADTAENGDRKKKGAAGSTVEKE